MYETLAVCQRLATHYLYTSGVQMIHQGFVGREHELTHLLTCLAGVLDGRGQIVLIAGEPGSGKTALIRQFAQRAQADHDDLVVAVGDCNAQTGIGDPYLPFREILGLLTGDVEAKLAQGAITAENAHRLRRFLGFSGEALVEFGPDLINLFVPGAGLISKAGTYLVDKVGWLDALHKLNERKAAELGGSGVDQSRIFEQYTNVLKALAAKKALLLVVDDLQWADAATASLLFHLGRRIGESCILIVGAYRPEEVALGWGDERHPLEKVVAEFKRYFGDISLDLGQAAETEGRAFVDAILDTEPNRLGDSFREALYTHTAGNPLFTIELLRAMQERGDLNRDAHGQWVMGPTLEWETFPARIEGVIEERIGRLDRELRDILAVASVEGEDFTAQVIARVQELRERRILHQLSEELDKRHRLVCERGELQVDRWLLSRYRFTHALFQRYLYSELGPGERRLLHGEIARVLEELHAGATEEVTVQLARHYVEAREDEKAIEYLQAAGNRARRLYANREAVEHYQRALALLLSTPRSSLRGVVAQIQESLGDVLEMTGQHDAAREAYQDALAQASAHDRLGQARLHRKIGNTRQVQRQFDDALHSWDMAAAILDHEPPEFASEWRQEWLQVQLDRMWAYYLRNQVPELVGLAEKVGPVLTQYGTSIQRAQFFERLVLMAYRRDRYVVSEETLADAKAAFAASQESGNLSEMGFAQFVLGFSHLWRAELDPAEANMRAGLKLAERAGDVTLQSRYLTYLTVICRKRGLVEETRHLIGQSVAMAQAGEMAEYMAAAKANLAWVAWREGKLVEAQENGRAALDLWQKLPIASPTQWLALWPLAGAALIQEQIREAIGHVRALLPPPQQILPPDLTAAVEVALQAWDAGHSALAEAHLHRAVQLAQVLGYL